MIITIIFYILSNLFILKNSLGFFVLFYYSNIQLNSVIVLYNLIIVNNNWQLLQLFQILSYFW